MHQLVVAEETRHRQTDRQADQAHADDPAGALRARDVVAVDVLPQRVELRPLSTPVQRDRAVELDRLARSLGECDAGGFQVVHLLGQAVAGEHGKERGPAGAENDERRYRLSVASIKP